MPAVPQSGGSGKKPKRVAKKPTAPRRVVSNAVTGSSRQYGRAGVTGGIYTPAEARRTTRQVIRDVKAYGTPVRLASEFTQPIRVVYGKSGVQSVRKALRQIQRQSARAAFKPSKGKLK